MSWVNLVKSWHDTSVDVCDVCGNLLIRRYWEFATDDGVVMRACRADDEQLYSWLARVRSHPPSVPTDRG
jgi:hypothetical protein